MSSYSKFMLVLMLAIGCSHSEVKVESENVEYRSFDNPVKEYTTISAPSSPLHALYLQWEVAHDRMVSSLDRGRLARLDAHRRVIQCLHEFISYYHSLKDSDLKKYLSSYQNLLEHVESGMPLRVVVRKYKDLEVSIRESLFVNP